MKAVYQTIYGIPGDLMVKELPSPVPGPKDIKVRVAATTINRSDIAMVTAIPFIMRIGGGLFKPKKNIPGTDFAGIIEAIGEEVTKFNVGDHIIGFDDRGLKSHAEELVLPEDAYVLKAPKDIPFTDLVACAEGAHYARNFLNKVAVAPKQTVLINGGTGAIGSALIQLSKQEGLIVTATSRKVHFDRVRELGATHLIDYEREDFRKINERFDFVFDAVGKSSFFQCKHLLKSGGSFISSELGPGWQHISMSLLSPFLRRIVFWKPIKTVKFPMPYGIMKSLSHMVEAYRQNNFRPLIDRIYPIDSAIEAYEYVRGGQKVGNVILSFQEEE